MTGRDYEKKLHDDLGKMKNEKEEMAKECQLMRQKMGQVRKGAKDWKKRALAAEKRCVELLNELVQMQNQMDNTMIAYREDVERYKKQERDMQNRRNMADCRIDNLKHELMEVKAHAYDLMKQSEEYDE